MSSSPKIDERNLDDAAKALAEILDSIAKFDRIWKLLTPQEQILTGGIVFNLQSVWQEKVLVGIIASPLITSNLLQRLIGFYDHPQRSLPDTIIEPTRNKESN